MKVQKQFDRGGEKEICQKGTNPNNVAILKSKISFKIQIIKRDKETLHGKC